MNKRVAESEAFDPHDFTSKSSHSHCGNLSINVSKQINNQFVLAFTTNSKRVRPPSEVNWVKIVVYLELEPAWEIRVLTLADDFLVSLKSFNLPTREFYN